MARAAVRLDELASDIGARHRGVRPVEQVEGDGFMLAFARASDALGCALDLQRAIAAEAWPGGLALRVRMALHTGDLELRDGGNAAGPTVFGRDGVGGSPQPFAGVVPKLGPCARGPADGVPLSPLWRRGFRRG